MIYLAHAGHTHDTSSTAALFASISIVLVSALAVAYLLGQRSVPSKKKTPTKRAKKK